ncbi:MAG TPA: hypothetical protein VG963_30620, partial [Polyangiaceae bacterium]|nr:hypothetical protein [Polyangiaceae bacterium]
LFPLALADSGWQKAGIDPHSFPPVPGEANLRQGTLPRLTIGSFDVPRVPAMYGFPFEDLEQSGGIHLDGVIGASLVSEFRASLADQGRTLWLEEMPAPLEEPSAEGSDAGGPAAAAPAAVPPAARANPKASGSSLSAKPAPAKAP